MATRLPDTKTGQLSHLAWGDVSHYFCAPNPVKRPGRGESLQLADGSCPPSNSRRWRRLLFAAAALAGLLGTSWRGSDIRPRQSKERKRDVVGGSQAFSRENASACLPSTHGYARTPSECQQKYQFTSQAYSLLEVRGYLFSDAGPAE